jgi:hypothetical protein
MIVGQFRDDTEVEVRFTGKVANNNAWLDRPAKTLIEDGFTAIVDEHGTYHLIWTADSEPGDEGSPLTVKESFVEGAAYKCAGGSLWLFVDNGWNTFGTSFHYDYDTPKRPLTRIDS